MSVSPARRAAAIAAGVAVLCLAGSSSRAEVYAGVDFPLGEISFADRVVTSDLEGTPGVFPPYDNGSLILGPPDTFHVSLGNAKSSSQRASIVVEFMDNELRDVVGFDLVVFEIGPAEEVIDVDISEDLITWYPVGQASGDRWFIDIGRHEVPPDTAFRYVRLRDAVGDDTSGEPYAGPDVDAVGAFGTDPQGLPFDVTHDEGCGCAAGEENPWRLGGLWVFLLVMGSRGRGRGARASATPRR